VVDAPSFGFLVRLRRLLLPGLLIAAISRGVGWAIDVFAPDKGQSAENRVRALLFNAKYMHHFRELGRGVILSKAARIRIDKNVALRNYVVIMPGRGFCHIGADTHIAHHSVLAAAGGITIGEDCTISSGVIIYSVTNGKREEGQRLSSAPPVLAPVVVGDHVHIGANVTILPGLTIGDWAVIGAGAVVTKDVAARSVVAGVPAKPLSDA